MFYQHILIKTNDIQPFSSILQQGFITKINPGYTLKQLLCNQFGISSDYVQTRIKTAFLNQRPVDNYDTAIVNDQDTLGLSGAMPGLVGATFRKNSVLSAFRSHISYSGISSKKNKKDDATITIKLFNFLIKEIGPKFLDKGLLITPGALNNIFETERSKHNKAAFKGVWVNGKRQLGHPWVNQEDELLFLIIDMEK